MTLAFVDDVTQVIGNKNKLEYKVYLQKAYEITEKYFQINMLAINKTKTELLHVPAPNEDLEEVIVMTSDGSVITSKNEVKILGVKFNFRNNMSSHLSSTASKVGMAYSQLKPYLRHASVQQRRLILTAKVESIALYAAPLIFNKNLQSQKRLERIMMKVNKWSYGKSTYRKKYA